MADIIHIQIVLNVLNITENSFTASTFQILQLFFLFRLS